MGFSQTQLSTPALYVTCQSLAVATQAHLVGCSAPLWPSKEQSLCLLGVSPVLWALRPSRSKVACQNVAVTTAHLFESSAPQWLSRPAGSQRDVMRCRPPVALKGLPALPQAAHACTQQERGLVLCGADKLQAGNLGFLCALPSFPDNSHAWGQVTELTASVWGTPSH